MVALVTGASSGIGMSVVEGLLAHKSADGEQTVVYAAARRVERMEPLREKGARILQLDVTDEKSMEKAVRTVLSEQGRLDVLVNNAGYGEYGPLECVTMENARRQFEVNVFGLARMCQLVLPAMREQKSGRIINVASMAAHFCEPRGGWYHATKYSVEALSDCLRMETHRFGVKVVLIEPGAIRTEWSDIAMDKMCAVSAGTPYEEGAAKQAGFFRWVYSHIASLPETVSKRIVRAATCRRPAIRYRCGLGSHTFSLLHALLPSRLFDALMRGLFD